MLETDIRRWFVCESSNRWYNAVRRFAPAMTPKPFILDVVSVTPDFVLDAIPPTLPSIVLWEVLPESLPLAAESLRVVHGRCRHTLQLVAGSHLSDREQMLLCELPIAMVVQQPEQLPRLLPLIQGHFASATEPVD
ncbi:MAG: hypothetical protein AAGG48_00555 [Planctomycetota bacterium]